MGTHVLVGSRRCMGWRPGWRRPICLQNPSWALLGLKLAASARHRQHWISLASTACACNATATAICTATCTATYTASCVSTRTGIGGYTTAPNIRWAKVVVGHTLNALPIALPIALSIALHSLAFFPLAFLCQCQGNSLLGGRLGLCQLRLG